MDSNTFLRAVGAKIRAARQRKNMTQTQLATACGYEDRASISEIEAGKTDISLTRATTIANCLGFDPLEFLAEDMFGRARLIEADDAHIGELLKSYEKLNHQGRSEAEKRVAELSKLSDYTEKGDACASSA